jgi:hypothetical protein
MYFMFGKVVHLSVSLQDESPLRSDIMIRDLVVNNKQLHGMAPPQKLSVMQRKLNSIGVRQEYDGQIWVPIALAVAQSGKELCYASGLTCFIV